MKDSVERRAMNEAMKHFGARGWTVTNVSNARKDHRGYDLFLQRGIETLKVEVKGSGKAYYGIPDLHGNELDCQGSLIADVLFVVYMPENLPMRKAIIPRDRIPAAPRGMQQKVTFCIRNEFKNLKFIQGFLEDPLSE